MVYLCNRDWNLSPTFLFVVWLVVAYNTPKSPDIWLWLSSLCKFLSSFEHFYKCIIISPWSLAPCSLSSRFNLENNNQDVMISSSFGAIKVCEARNMVFISLQPQETGRNCILLKVIRGKETLNSVWMQITAQTGHTGGERVILLGGCLWFMNLCPQISLALVLCRTERTEALVLAQTPRDWFWKVLCIHRGIQA